MGSNIGFALMLTTLAGLSTTIGGAMGVLVRKPGPSFMALTLGFSAGVMILVSFVELLQAGIEGVGFAPAPIYAATGSRRKAFLWSFFSGVAEPIGAGLAAVVLLPFLNEAVLGYVLAAVAGIMVFISLDELIPVARSFGKEHLSIAGVVVGMIVMARSLWMLQ